MPSNIIKINNGGKCLEFIVSDSKMGALIEYLKANGEVYKP